MDSNYIFRKIASKAEYIADAATSALVEKIADDKTVGMVDAVNLNDIMQQLENIAEVIDWFVNW